MSDIVAELEAYRASLRQADLDHEAPLAVMLGTAVAEIKHLRQLAGKVSSGFTFNEIKRDAKNFKEADSA